MSNKYKMTISRLTIDKLGMKMYDKVSAVIAEMVANSYDADAREVTIKAPMNEFLATKAAGTLKDKNYSIEVIDDGIGMTPDEVNDFYLKVGAERRLDQRRGDISPKLGRKVMGRKGVGKLAPYGVCKRVEIISSGGEEIEVEGENGKKEKGYLTAHLILLRSKMLKDTDSEYYPDLGEFDGEVRSRTGTTVKLRSFDYRRVPTMETFERQLAQRFGVVSHSWKINLVDTIKSEDAVDGTRTVGEFAVSKMENTEIRFEEVLDEKNEPLETLRYRAVNQKGEELVDIKAGFSNEGKFYALTGWVAYSKQPYKDDLMAGVRIYCRGKIAAQTLIFNMKAGFTGEYDIRSYLIGELHADWLDEEEDLIQTDRQDILWSHELGQVFQTWGQALVKKIGTMTREPRRVKAWQQFEQLSDIHDKVAKAFPEERQKLIRENTIEIAKAMAKTTREDELKDPQHVESIVNLSLLLGPHITLDRKLREAAESTGSP